MKLGIVIIVFNIDTRIFVLQIESIKKFCKDGDYTIEVVDNSSNDELGEAIKHHSIVQGVEYRKTNSNSKDPSVSHSFAANFAFQKLKHDYDLFFFLDHDCIPVKPFSVEEILGEKYIGGVLSGTKIKHYWPGCLMWRRDRIEENMIDFSPNNKLGIDTGGESYKIIEKYKENCLFFDEIGCRNEYFNDTPLYYFYMMICNRTFIHFLNASGWNPTEGNGQRINSLINITNNLISEEE